MRVIFNIDDFGLRPSINRSVVVAARSGLALSCSLLVNQPASAEAAALARQNPALAVGLHLDLDELFGFTGSGHYGATIHDIPRARYAAFDDDERLEAAIEAQFQQCAALGVAPDHLDGHYHVHLFPKVLPTVLRAMRRHGLRRLRFWPGFYADDEAAREQSLALLAATGMQYPAQFLNLGDYQPHSAVGDAISADCCEVMVHTDESSSREAWRVSQLAYVTSGEALAELRRRGLTPATYAALGG